MLVSPHTRLSKYQLGFAPVVFCLLILFGLKGVAIGQSSGTSSGATDGSNRTNTEANSIRGKVYLPSGAMPEQRMRVLLEISTVVLPLKLSPIRSAILNSVGDK